MWALKVLPWLAIILAIKSGELWPTGANRLDGQADKDKLRGTETESLDTQGRNESGSQGRCSCAECWATFLIFDDQRRLTHLAGSPASHVGNRSMDKRNSGLHWIEMLDFRN